MKESVTITTWISIDTIFFQKAYSFYGFNVLSIWNQSDNKRAKKKNRTFRVGKLTCLWDDSLLSTTTLSNGIPILFCIRSYLMTFVVNIN